jgi:ketosteroid isomerase-like protein
MTTSCPDMSDAVLRIQTFFEQLQPQDVRRISEFYTPGAHFKDPFNEVQGQPEIERIFSHMFVALNEPRFVITERVLQGRQCFLTWDFNFRFKRLDTRTLQTVKGASHLVLDEHGLIEIHRDYWDAAEELYEKLPLLGGLMRWLKRQAAQ